MYRLLLLLAGLIHTTHGDEAKERNITCSDYGEWGGLNLSAIQGSWRVNELVMHLDQYGSVKYLTCPVINITEVPVTEKPRHVYGPSTESSQYHHRAVFQTNYYREWRQLRLLWDEAGNDVEYSLFFKNDSVGFWSSHGDQIGTLPGNRNYKQFTGTVQVLKAVGDHLLLHFCQPPTNGQQAQLFSILLSREPQRLQKWEINAAHDLLRRKNLSVTTRRLVCGNSGYKTLASMMSLLLAAFCALFGHKTV